jgi:hypothetical protein
MGRGNFVVLVLVCALVAGGCTPERYAQRSRGSTGRQDTLGLMSNHDVIAMANSGIADSVIIQLIQTSGTAFHLLPQDIIALADSGVRNHVISAMIDRGASSQVEDNSGGYYHYPPYYWYAGYPYWDPWFSWYPSLYFGFASGYFPRYAYGYYSAPYYGHYGWSGGYGLRGRGGYHYGGRRR